MDRDIITKFFTTLFPEGNYYVEFRYKTDKDVVKQKFFLRNELNKVIDEMIEYEDKIKNYEMWFGVCPRINKSGKKEDIKQIFCLWTDIDRKERIEIKDFLMPNIIINSGHGKHLYWLLNKPFEITSTQDIDYIESILKGISQKLGGDKTHDITRVLRIPETYNNKDKKNPKKVIIEHFDNSFRYDIKDFEQYKINIEQTQDTTIVVNEKVDVNIDDYAKELPVWLIEAIKEGYKEGDHKYKSRSELDLAVMMSLIHHNFTDEMIFSIFTNPKYKISEKTLQKDKHAIDYLQLTLQKAKSYYQIKREKFLEKISNFSNFEEVIKVYQKWFHIEDDTILRIIHACILAHKFNAKPLWILLLAPPSGTKTSVLQDLNVLEQYNVKFLSEITAKTFVSGDKHYQGLLNEVKNGILIFKDFTSILQLDSTTRNEIIQQLREIWDGMYDKKYGTGKSVHWEGKITVLAGCTEAYETFREIDQTLGERFLIYRPTIEDREQMIWKSLAQVNKEKQMRKELQTAIKWFHNSIDFNEDDEEFFTMPEEILQKLVSLANIITLLRSGVKRDYKKEIEYVPEPELPARLAQQLLVLLKALTLLHRKITATNVEYDIVKKVALMTIHLKKYKILKFFIEKNNELYTTTEVAQALNIPRQTIYRYLEELWCFKILDKYGSEDRPQWKINNDFLVNLKVAEI